MKTYIIQANWNGEYVTNLRFDSHGRPEATTGKAEDALEYTETDLTEMNWMGRDFSAVVKPGCGGYKIKRSDGRFMRYTYDNRASAETDARDLFDAAQPFTYSVVETNEQPAR